MTERLQKYLAAAGVASRRKAEEMILAGRVKVNAAIVTALGTKIEPGRDLVTVDGKLVAPNDARAYYLLYKPSGCVTTAADPEGRPTAFEYLRGVSERVFPVGRLDWDAEGAILFTDDGELANRLAHPRYGHRRTYLVKVKGDPAREQLLRMTTGVRLDDGPACALEATVHERVEKNVWIRVVVGEGRFHLVKRLCEAVGLQVQRLFRPEFGGLTVDGLRPGRFRPLSPSEVHRLRQAVGLEGGAAEPSSSLPRSALPRAARRHGHGPPAPPGGKGEPARSPAPSQWPGAGGRRPQSPGAPDDGPPRQERRGPGAGRPESKPRRPDLRGPPEREGPRQERRGPGRPESQSRRQGARGDRTRGPRPPRTGGGGRRSR